MERVRERERGKLEDGLWIDRKAWQLGIEGCFKPIYIYFSQTLNKSACIKKFLHH